jgi:hypothetical protein
VALEARPARKLPGVSAESRSLSAPRARQNAAGKKKRGTSFGMTGVMSFRADSEWRRLLRRRRWRTEVRRYEFNGHVNGARDKINVKFNYAGGTPALQRQRWRRSLEFGCGSRGKPRWVKAAALRSRTAGSQDESRCGAIHKPPHSI